VEDQQIIDKSDLRKWRTELPNMYDDADLDPYEFRLLVHYVRVGTCWQNTRTTAKICHMSIGQVCNKRKSLASKGFINLTHNEHGTFTIEIVNKWHENFATYSQREQCSPHEQDVHPMNDECSPHETKKEPITKKEPTKKTSAQKVAPTEPTAQYQFMQTIGEVCMMDLALNAGQIGKIAKGLLKTGYTIEQVKAGYSGKLSWWYKTDWRGQKGQPPKPADIAKTIKQAVGSTKSPTVSGDRNGGSVAQMGA